MAVSGYALIKTKIVEKNHSRGFLYHHLFCVTFMVVV